MDTTSPASPFPPIAEYAFLSDCHTGALVAPDGSVDWLCVPRFDSPSIFGSLLDRGAGYFRFAPYGINVPTSRAYDPGTNVLVTTWHTPAGWVEMMELINSAPPRSLIVDFNSQTADGRDPSWIWDVPFERLAGRPVLVTGDRKEDMSVRLAYAGVRHTVYPSAEEAADAAGDARLDVVANYTAFRDLLVRTTPAPRPPTSPAAPAPGGAW